MALGAALAATGTVLLSPLVALLGADPADPELWETCRQYMKIVLLGIPLFFTSYLLNYFLRNDDQEKLASFGFTVGNLSDIALNIVLVLYFDFGAAGAAWSTLAGQAISLCVYLVGMDRRENHLRLFPLHPALTGVWDCFRVGFTSSAQYLFTMLFLFMSNHALLRTAGSVGVVFPLPLIPLLLTLDANAYWWLYPISEAGTLLVFLAAKRLWDRAERELEPSRVYHRIIGTREDDIAAVLADAESFCDRWEANPKQAYFVTITVEELCTAIVKKGFQGKDGFLQVTLVAYPDGDFSLHIRDSAVSFDPFSLQTERAGSAAGVDMDAMGVLVIRQKAKEFFYRRYQGFNNLVVRI